MAKRQKESVAKTDAEMKKAPKKAEDKFGFEQISDLVNLMKKNELTEFSFENGKFKISLKRGCGETAGAVPVQAVYPAAVPPAPAAVPAAEKPAASEEDDSHIELVKSPMVGTFYAASSPTNPPFVSVGDVVGPDKTVCIIEAMKVYNEIKAEISGKIVAVLVKNGEAVEFGRPLFKVDTRG